MRKLREGVKKIMKNVSFDNIVKFQDIEEFYLPKNCVICGDETENRIEKSEYGSYTTSKDYKKIYKFELPICEECNSKVNLKAGKSGVIIVLSVILGITFICKKSLNLILGLIFAL